MWYDVSVLNGAYPNHLAKDSMIWVQVFEPMQASFAKKIWDSIFKCQPEHISVSTEELTSMSVVCQTDR